jgi:hypothetical protein
MIRSHVHGFVSYVPASRAGFTDGLHQGRIMQDSDSRELKDSYKHEALIKTPDLSRRTIRRSFRMHIGAIWTSSLLDDILVLRRMGDSMFKCISLECTVCTYRIVLMVILNETAQVKREVVGCDTMTKFILEGRDPGKMR